jgi:hypothetical protein
MPDNLLNPEHKIRCGESDRRIGRSRSGKTSRKTLPAALAAGRSVPVLFFYCQWATQSRARRVRQPVSRVLSPPPDRATGDGHSSGAAVAGRLARPTRTTGPETDLPAAAGASSLLGLAPGGVYRAAAVAGAAVRSCRTLSPSPAGPESPAGRLLSVALSLGSPPPGITRHRVSVEPGLSSPGDPGSGHPAT